MSFAVTAGAAPLRGVVVGAGALGPHWGYELHHSPDVTFAGWVDLVPARAREAAAAVGAHDVAVGAEVVATLEDVRPEFIVDVSPPTAHHAVTLAALDRGVHVLSEKPMAATLAEAIDMIAAADPLSVYCEASNPPWSWYDGDAAADAIFTMTGGLRFAFTGNWAGDGFRMSWTGSWRATGERGSVIWEDEGAPVVSPAPGERIEAVAPATLVRGPERFPGLEFSLAEFVDALRTGRVPAGECHDNIRSLAMCHAAVESARTGRRVAIDTLVA